MKREDAALPFFLLNYKELLTSHINKQSGQCRFGFWRTEAYETKWANLTLQLYKHILSVLS